MLHLSSASHVFYVLENMFQKYTANLQEKTRAEVQFH